VEGLADGDQLSDLQQAFSDHHALQCGFCTPGFLLLAEAYLAQRGSAGPPAGPGGSGPDSPGGPDDPGGLTEAEVRELVASNLCRCTGYQGIIEAVLATAGARRRAAEPTAGQAAGPADGPAAGPANGPAASAADGP